MIPIAKPQIGREEQEAVAAVLLSGHLASGQVVQRFEAAFAALCGVPHAVACANGTVALQAALEGLGVGPGDEVVVPAFTFIATANAVLYVGARLVFVDVVPETFTMDAAALARAITPKTKAVIPVHLFGQAADMKALGDVVAQGGVPMLGDAAQAHGAEQGGKRVGGFGACETFSFYPTKNMTCGEGGMITVGDATLAGRIRSIVNHGRGQLALGTYDHVRRGSNFRLTDVHAAIGLAQLAKLEGFNARRREIAHAYDKAFSKLSHIRPPTVLPGNLHVFHQYTLDCDNRAAVTEALKAGGVGFGLYYPKALHQYPHLAPFGHGGLRQSERLATRVVSIPVHPALSPDDVSQVIRTVEAADKASGHRA